MTRPRPDVVRDVADEVIVLTGGASPLGLALGRAFRAAGGHVVATDPAAGPDLRRLTAGDPMACGSLARQVAEEHGRLGVWVNHHPWERLGPAETLPIGAWREGFDTIATATFVGAQAAASVMLEQGEGVIVNVTTVDAYRPAQGRVALAAAHAAVVRLTEALAVEWAPRGIRVVGVATSVPDPPGVSPNVRRIPLARAGRVDEVAAAIVYIASREASYVVGETLRVDGGWSAYQLF